MRQILVNLVGNALKFTEKGEVELRVTCPVVANSRLTLQFAVRDTGIGIPPEAQTRLFNSFTQVDASTTRKYGGTGLGLAISKRLAEMMGGRIWLESVPGVGSTFCFTIGVEAAPAERKAVPLSPGVQLSGLRLLIVDDNSANRRILSNLAKKWGLHAAARGSGAMALAALQEGQTFDLAILDMQMPEMDGVMLARQLRKLPATAELPLMLLTSLGRLEVVAESNLFSQKLHKPVKPAQIHAALLKMADQSTKAGVPFRHPTRPPGQAEKQPDRLLLAEDNIVNQKVARSMLAKLGFQAEVANNGHEVLAALTREDYDIILMDVQMPEMDGIEATRQIIARQPEPGRRPWIIALTANAMEGDRELCLAAGMDDYISKPIKPADLSQALARARRTRLANRAA